MVSCFSRCNWSVAPEGTTSRSCTLGAVVATAALTAIAVAVTFACFYYGMASSDYAFIAYIGATSGIAAVISLYWTFQLIFNPKGPKDDGLVPYITAAVVLGAPLTVPYFIASGIKEKCFRRGEL